MTPDQVRLLVNSFEKVKPISEEVAKRFYENLFRRAPEFEHKFQNVDMPTQGQMVLQAVGLAIDSLNNFDDVRPVLEGLGKRHVNYGVHSEHFAIAGSALVETLQQTFGKDFTPDLEQAWRDVLATVIGVIVEGANRTSERVSAKGKRDGVGWASEESADSYLARFLPEDYSDQEPVNTDADLSNLNKTINIEYVHEAKVHGVPLQTILDISLQNQIPHTRGCGGLAKCSTCRVLIVDGLNNCLPRNALEAEMAKRKGFPQDVRLACQTRVTGSVKIRRLVQDAKDAKDAVGGGMASVGREMKLAVMFLDIRDFTSFSERNLPYDIMHALNRFFTHVGGAIDRHQGFIDKFMGDGLMALFGLNPERENHPCDDAVNAALDSMEVLEEINAYLTRHLGDTFDIGIGIHYGAVVVGEMGFDLKKQFTAIGDTVNVAARLECATRDSPVKIFVSHAVRLLSSDGICEFGMACELDIKGKSESQRAYELLQT
jgi:class 3 adenylate cyclase/hemoglobin-like flavoprotein